MKKRSQISNEKEKLLSEKNKKGVRDISENMFCLVVSPYNIFWKIEYGMVFLNRGSLHKRISQSYQYHSELTNRSI